MGEADQKAQVILTLLGERHRWVNVTTPPSAGFIAFMQLDEGRVGAPATGRAIPMPSRLVCLLATPPPWDGENFLSV